MKKITFALVAILLSMATTALADFTVKVSIEEDTFKNRKVWAKPLAEFVVKGNKLKSTDLDKHLFGSFTRAGLTQLHYQSHPYRVDISFETEGSFRVVNKTDNDQPFLASFGLSKKKYHGEDIWYSSNGGEWVNVALQKNTMAKSRHDATQERSAEVFHTGGRVDLRFYTSPSSDVFFSIVSKGGISPVKAVDYPKNTSLVATDGYDYGFRESTQAFYSWPKEDVNIVPDFEEEYRVRTHKDAALFIRKANSPNDLRPTFSVIKFGLIVESPGIVQIGYIPHVTSSTMSTSAIPGFIRMSTQGTKGAFFATEIDNQYIALKSYSMGNELWSSFYANDPGIYSVALYELNQAALDIKDVRTGGKDVSMLGEVVFKAPHEKDFRIIGPQDVVLLHTDEPRDNGLYAGEVPLKDFHIE